VHSAGESVAKHLGRSVVRRIHLMV
jgi:hypothetical protein